MKRKVIAVLCAVGILVLVGTMPVMAEEHVDVETLERGAQAAENVSAEAEGDFSYKDLKGLTFAFSSGVGAVSYTHLDVYKRQGMCFLQ